MVACRGSLHSPKEGTQVVYADVNAKHLSHHGPVYPSGQLPTSELRPAVALAKASRDEKRAETKPHVENALFSSGFPGSNLQIQTLRP